MGLSPFSVTILLNHLLEELAHEHFLHELANEVSLGRTVRLPGFGVFSARYYASCRTCAPRFQASKAFRLQTRHSAPLDLANHRPSPLLTRGRSRPAWPLEEEEVTTREAILKALEAAD
ncbi:MAG: hypothetical protein ISQ08_03910 [Planctomycetes bacterium]|nr:hypothetical protein [Planctomycetota bacterium]